MSPLLTTRPGSATQKTAKTSPFPIMARPNHRRQGNSPPGSSCLFRGEGHDRQTAEPLGQAIDRTVLLCQVNSRSGIGRHVRTTRI